MTGLWAIPVRRGRYYRRRRTRLTLVRMGARLGIAPDEQSSLVAGPFGTPIAENLSPDSVEYAEAAATDKLDEQEDVTERQL